MHSAEIFHYVGCAVLTRKQEKTAEMCSFKLEQPVMYVHTMAASLAKGGEEEKKRLFGGRSEAEAEAPEGINNQSGQWQTVRQACSCLLRWHDCWAAAAAAVKRNDFSISVILF